MKIRFLFSLAIFSVQFIVAQQYAGLSIDNDLFFGKDYYYSSGIFLEYGYSKDEKKNIHWRLGNQIFNPIKRYDSITTQMDYPFSGYLFLERLSSYRTNKNTYWAWGVQIGLSGPPSLSKTIQNSYHQYVLGLPPLSWEGQQAAGFHFGIKGAYTHITALGEKIHFTKELKTAIGTHQTETAMRAGLQWGQINPIVFYGLPLRSQESGWGSHLGFEFKYNLQDYNISGSIFNDHSPFTLPSKNFRNTLEAGLAYRSDQWQFIALAKSRSKDNSKQKYDRHQVLYLSVLKIF